MAEVETTTAEEEHQFHDYVGSRIPWYVHLLWLMFWMFVVYYIVTWQLPALKTELLSPP